jgi:hypothetical protein
MQKVKAFTANTGGQDCQWSLEVGFDLNSDFCVWVLEEDGMRVSPFNSHVGGTNSLRSVGMREVDWQSWFSKVVLLQDSRLLLGDPQRQQHALSQPFSSPTEEVDIDLSEIGIDVQELGSDPEEIERNLLSNFSEILPKIEEALNSRKQNSTDRRMDYVNRMEQGYQLALKAIKRYLREPLTPNLLDRNPPDLWDGEQVIKEQIGKLWKSYQVVLPQRQKKCEELLDKVEPSVVELLEMLTPYHSRLDTLGLYLVSYSAPVEYLIPSVSVVLSVSDEAETEPVFMQRVLTAVADLVSLSHSQDDSK